MSKKHTFLSLDLDYWSENHADAGMIPALRQILELDVPIHCVTYHHEMVEMVNRTKDINRLVNMDYHSDFGDISPRELIKPNFNEGTWINFVKFASTGSFLWVYPEDKCYDCTGRCDTNFNPFTVRNDKVGRTCWLKSARRLGGENPMKRVHLTEVAEIGISISPDWNTIQNTYDALEFLSRENRITTRMHNTIIKLMESEKTHWDYEKEKLAIGKRVYSKMSHVR